jgi:hypothetical protein
LLFLTEAERAAEELGQMKNRYVMYDRACFLSLTEQLDEAMAAWKACQRPGAAGFTPMVFAPFACLHDRSKEAIETLQGIAATDDTHAKLALAYLQARDPSGRGEALRTYHEIVEGHKDCDARMFALYILLMLQEPDEAEDRARELLGSSQELILPYKAHMEFLAGGCQDRLLRESPALGHFDIALKAFSEGDWPKARRHFDDCCAKSSFIFAQFWWSRVYLAELRKQPELN